jgi:hypothetical protein
MHGGLKKAVTEMKKVKNVDISVQGELKKWCYKEETGGKVRCKM